MEALQQWQIRRPVHSGYREELDGPGSQGEGRRGCRAGARVHLLCYQPQVHCTQHSITLGWRIGIGHLSRCAATHRCTLHTGRLTTSRCAVPDLIPATCATCDTGRLVPAINIPSPYLLPLTQIPEKGKHYGLTALLSSPVEPLVGGEQQLPLIVQVCVSGVGIKRDKGGHVCVGGCRGGGNRYMQRVGKASCASGGA